MINIKFGLHRQILYIALIVFSVIYYMFRIIDECKKKNPDSNRSFGQLLDDIFDSRIIFLEVIIILLIMGFVLLLKI
jgi:hypothetical protein